MKNRPDRRFEISADRLEILASSNPLALVEFDGDIAHLLGYPVPFWAQLESAPA